MGHRSEQDRRDWILGGRSFGVDCWHHFDKAYIPNSSNTSLRPDFMVLVYPVISMASELTHQGSRDALLGKNPAAPLVQLFSNDQQVTERTPPALLLHATDDPKTILAKVIEA